MYCMCSLYRVSSKGHDKATESLRVPLYTCRRCSVVLAVPDFSRSIPFVFQHKNEQIKTKSNTIFAVFPLSD